MKFIKKTSVMFLMMLSTVILISLLPGNYAHDLAALINKRELLTSKKSPRIIFIGGSNLATLRSRSIELEINRSKKTKYSVVNMGLWGGLSIERYLEELKPYLRTGDIVIICQEYATLLHKEYFLYIKKNKESKKFFFLMSPKKHILSSLKKGKYFDIIEKVFVLNQLKIKSYINNILDLEFERLFGNGYQRYHKDYNRYGDRRFPFRVKRPLTNSGMIFQEPDINNLLYLKDFNIYSKEKSIKILFVFPPFPDREYHLNKRCIDSLFHCIKNILKLNILNRPVDNIYPVEYFADTVNHLRPEGEKIRTKKMIKGLKRVLDR